MAGPGGRAPMMNGGGGGAHGNHANSQLLMIQRQHHTTAANIPPAWKEAKAPNGKAYWYIPGTTKTTWEKPDSLRTDDELPPNWTRYTSVQGLPYYHNSVTKETTYTRPKAVQKLDSKKVAARVKIPNTVWVLVRNGEGKVFFFNSESKKSQFRKPDELVNITLPQLPSLDTGSALDDNKRSAPSTVTDTASKRQRVDPPPGHAPGPRQGSLPSTTQPPDTEDDDSDANDDEAMLLAAMEEEAELERETQETAGVPPGDGGSGMGGHNAEIRAPPVPGLVQPPPAYGAPHAGMPLQHAPPPMMPPPVGVGMPPPPLHTPFPTLPPPSVRSLEQRHEAKFLQMLHDRKVDALTSWDHELPRIQNDYRFEKVASAKKRRELFDQYQASLVQDVALVTKKKKEADKAAFRELLEGANIRPKTDFRTFRAKFAKDPRFKRISKAKDQQAMFLEFQRNIGKAGNKVAATGTGGKVTKESIMQDFFELLYEARFVERARWHQVQHVVQHDPRCIAVADDERRDIYFTAFQKCPKDRSPATVKKRAELVEKLVVENSQRRREMEVRRTTEATEYALGREREQYVRTDQVARFESMLVDYVRTVDCTWADVARDLQHDARWALVNALSHYEKEDLFTRYIGALKDKRRAAFRSMLDANDAITIATSWDDARAVVCTDTQFLNLSDSDSVREKEYHSYIEMRRDRAKREFRELCSETRVISHKSHELMEDEDSGHIHSDEINHALGNDKRYSEMASIPEERDKILTEYILELHQKGPPPPPTASNRDSTWR
eukprot:m.739227 g.739227  ORF g.739227 m.739227 type:complete len:782 (+) comp23105_c0_seq2:369-2714(+)